MALLGLQAIGLFLGDPLDSASHCERGALRLERQTPFLARQVGMQWQEGPGAATKGWNRTWAWRWFQIE